MRRHDADSRLRHVIGTKPRRLIGSMETSCCVCKAESVKYRCPRCRVRYCSLTCCKTHKETCVPKEATTSTEASFLARGEPHQTKAGDLTEDDDSDKVSLQKLKMLDESDELKHLLLNPHLQRLISALDQAENKDQELKKYMQEPLFVEFADKCLFIVDTEEKENIFKI
ncbi:zinc finger HIT domain-containing protein 3 [Rana temporaria]|uniref:zinc finger HIT domain-containing protein 3 n=1 Tax=Rana temporaria TaxID=8407 RepID=UPI001AAD7E87|nr:zinc finger HIT domain-containing protein 3 [Rana temporaria]